MEIKRVETFIKWAAFFWKSLILMKIVVFIPFYTELE